MRYDGLLRRLEAIREKYENEVRDLLRATYHADRDIAKAIGTPARARPTNGRKKKRPHWASTPEGKRRMSAIMKAKWAKKKGGEK